MTAAGACAECVEAAQPVRPMVCVVRAHRHAKEKIAVMMDAEGAAVIVPSGVAAHRKGNAYAPRIALEKNAAMTGVEAFVGHVLVENFAPPSAHAPRVFQTA